MEPQAKERAYKGYHLVASVIQINEPGHKAHNQWWARVSVLNVVRMAEQTVSLNDAYFADPAVGLNAALAYGADLVDGKRGVLDV